MKDKIFLDIGSSTTKVYKFSNGVLSHLENKSILLSDGFSPEKGISKENKKDFLSYLKQIKTQHDGLPIEVFATSIFRKMDEKVRENLIEEILKETGVNFNVISHEMESFYMQQALIGKYTNDPALIINIGGGSTELIVIKNKRALETHKLENLGVGTLMKKYPQVNTKVSEISLERLVAEIKEILPEIKEKTEVAFYSGGELTYMQLAKYNLKENSLFKDEYCTLH